MFKKEIIINNDDDLKKFYKRIKIYKSVFYIKTKFTTKNNKIKSIIEALNIKSRNKRITYVYDNACKYIDNYWKNKNICGFKNNKCYTQQKLDCKYQNGCCRRCLYQSDKGCTTSNLTCKLFYCTEVTKKYKVPTMNDIKILKVLSLRQRTILKHDYFSSREEVLMDLYINSITIFTIRIILRYIIKNIV